jgi:hypothetical protein
VTPGFVRYVNPRKFEELTGYALDLIERNIATGVWRQGHEYRIAPDGRTLIDMDGYNRWIEGKETPGRGLIRLRV